MLLTRRESFRSTEAVSSSVNCSLTMVCQKHPAPLNPVQVLAGFYMATRFGTVVSWSMAVKDFFLRGRAGGSARLGAV